MPSHDESDRPVPELDRALASIANRYRPAGQPSFADLRSGRSRRLRLRAGVGVAAAAVGVFAIVVGPELLAGQAPTPNSGAAASASPVTSATSAEPNVEPSAVPGPLDAWTTRDGDEVTATGIVVAAAGSALVLCTPAPMLLAGALLSDGSPGDEQRLSCSPTAVPLAGVDESLLPGWEERDGGGFTKDTITVDGVWRAGTLVVDSVTAGGETPQAGLDGTWQVPCAPPEGGWVAEGGGLFAGVAPAEMDNSETALADEVAAHPDLYHGNWYGYPDGDPHAAGAPTGEGGGPAPEHIVMMVSTVQDPNEVREHLAALYPGNLCVTQVQRSRADLDAVVARLETVDSSWVLEANSLYADVANAVLLELPVLDAIAVNRIGADAAALSVWPLVRPL